MTIQGLDPTNGTGRTPVKEQLWHTQRNRAISSSSTFLRYLRFLHKVPSEVPVRLSAEWPSIHKIAPRYVNPLAMILTTAGSGALHGCLTTRRRVVANAMKTTLLLRTHPDLYLWLKAFRARAEAILAHAKNPLCRLQHKPPACIPSRLHSKFTMGGQATLLYRYADDSQSRPTVYEQHAIESTCSQVAAGRLGRYGGIDAWLYAALKQWPIRGQRVGIMGSADQGYGPWYEAICLQFRGHPITIDYNRIVFQDSRIQFVKAPVDPALLDRFDCAFSISSFEHDGLGRYGDPLDPDADLKAMLQMKRLIKTGGLLFLSVPLGIDKVIFNLHRIYGGARLPRLLESWTVLGSFGFERALLDRDTGYGWEPVQYGPGPEGMEKTLLHPQYPEYGPVWVLRND